MLPMHSHIGGNGRSAANDAQVVERNVKDANEAEETRIRLKGQLSVVYDKAATVNNFLSSQEWHPATSNSAALTIMWRGYALYLMSNCCLRD